MHEELSIDRLIKKIKEAARQFPDLRTGKNTQYEMEDAALGAFSVFFTQSASFLEYQQDMKRQKGRSNAESLFEMVDIPSDSQIRVLLDPVDPGHVKSIFRDVFRGLEQGQVLEGMRSHGNSLLMAMDGTEYFSSQKVHCEKCSQRELRNGKINYYHSVLTPVIVQAGNEHVIALEPEFITPQDGNEKQDCEIEAGKRWISQYGDFYAKQNVAILGDDLFSRQPFVQALKDAKLHFILVCKPDSHLALYEMVSFLQSNGVLSTYQKRHWNGRFGEIYTYRYANKLPLRGDQDTIDVNWCELTITREDTGNNSTKMLFAPISWSWKPPLKPLSGMGALVGRWKTRTTMSSKPKAITWNIISATATSIWHPCCCRSTCWPFLFHTVLDLVDDRYRLIRQELRTRRNSSNTSKPCCVISSFLPGLTFYLLCSRASNST